MLTVTNQTHSLCASRNRFAAVFLIVTYLLSGMLHQSFDVDVTSPAGQIVLSTASVPTDPNAPPGIHADHHCHGCFPVSLQDPPSLAVMIEHHAATVPQGLTQASDLVPGIDTPPPKS
ncbi:hypothetical protein NB311A_17494 [Nitrobacter sp. Nb-311A]|nr:hypothetical protein NB311A_17494 [Nitrobacter sp. Nb-311A]